MACRGQDLPLLKNLSAGAFLARVPRAFALALLAVPLLPGFGWNAQAQTQAGADGAAPGFEEGWSGPGDVENAEPGPEVVCNFGEWIGSQADDRVKADLKAMNRVVRFLAPDAPMTMDYSPDRVNFSVDADGKITGAWCG